MAFPVEVKPGQSVQDVGPETVLPFDAPNIVGGGFFWTEERLDLTRQAHPVMLSYPLPDGNAAVMSFASDHEQPRHAVVLKFDPQQCEAVSVQHIDF